MEKSPVLPTENITPIVSIFQFGFPISAFDKIRLEAPYHALTNAGHISYVELDGDTANNVEAFESVVRCMHDAGIDMEALNHPVDRTLFVAMLA